MPVEIEIAGLAEALDRFAQGDAQIGKALVKATHRSTSLLRQRLGKYPAKSTGKMVFKSAKQRRFFFAALREGKIQIPYRRSGTLGRRWYSRVNVGGGMAGDVAGFVGNLTPYARYVQGFSEQAPIHKGNWQTEQDVAHESRDEIVGFFNEAITEFL